MQQGKRRPQGFRDIFSGDPHAEVAVILGDGTSVEFPKGWTEQDVLTWRQYCGLLPSSTSRKML